MCNVWFLPLATKVAPMFRFHSRASQNNIGQQFTMVLPDHKPLAPSLDDRKIGSPIALFVVALEPFFRIGTDEMRFP